MHSTETASFDGTIVNKNVECRKNVETKLLTAAIKRENYRKGTSKKPKTLTSKAFECKRRASRQYSIGSYGLRIQNFVNHSAFFKSFSNSKKTQL